MIKQPVLHASTDTLDVTVGGLAVDWALQANSRRDMAAAVLRLGNMPIQGTNSYNRFVLDMLRLKSSSFWLNDSSNLSMEAYHQETNLDWYIASANTIRSTRYGSTGQEAISGLTDYDAIGNVRLTIKKTATEFLDTLVDAEGETAGPASSKLKDWARDRLRHLYEYAKLDDSHLEVVVPLKRQGEAWFATSPLYSGKIATKTGVISIPTGIGIEVNISEPDNMLKAVLDMLDDQYENAASQPDYLASLQQFSGSDTMMVGYMNRELQSASSSSYPSVPVILGTSVNDACLWYYLASCAFRKDQGVKGGLASLGNTTLAQAFLESQSQQEFCPIAK